jgi:RNA polymerase sigma-70 factor, ECF subfamily
METQRNRSTAAGLPDAELARRSGGGERQALEALMRRYNQKLYRTARSILKDDAEAEDAVQDAYLLAFRAIGSFRGDAQLSTWLVRIVVNESLGRLRNELRGLIEARIDQLPDAFRTVFVLRTLEDMTVEDVAACLDIPEATVRTRYFRAKGMLRESLARDIDLGIGDSFSFAGARCDRIVAGVLARLHQD